MTPALIRRRRPALAALATICVLAASGSHAHAGDDARARVKARCGKGAQAELRLRARDGAIAVEFEVRGRDRARWRIVLVQEHRVVWRAAMRASGGGSVRIRRTIPDLSGADQVMARASGPRGVTCEAGALLGG